MEEVERRYVLTALGVVIGVVALLATVDLLRDVRAEELTRIELMRRCLEKERGFPVLELPVNSFLAEAEQGGLRAIVEVTNEVRVGIAGSEATAGRFVREAIRRTQNRRRVERRGDIVVVWKRPPSPTQRQTVFECAY